MNKPLNEAAIAVPMYFVAHPGVSPLSVNIRPEICVLGWKFGEMDRGELIDRVKQVETSLAALDKWMEAAREVLKQTLPKPAKAGEETVTRGVLYEAHYKYSTRTDIDRDKVKAHFGANYPQYCRTSDIYTLKIVPVVQTPAA